MTNHIQDAENIGAQSRAHAPPMTPEEIAAYLPDAVNGDNVNALERARRKFEVLGLRTPGQQMGQRWPVGCVALEVTQRCNLDCTLCYLSENSEAVKDIPLDEVLRRVDEIYCHYGRNTDVQVTGGEPTLRKRSELCEIVRKIRSCGMRSALMTNGIKADHTLLRELADCGLNDVVFHVDTSQLRQGYHGEMELNRLRLAYIERAADLPLSVMFNTTVHDGNFAEIPALVEFFRSQAGRVRTASFQLQADIGRGVQRARAAMITPDSVAVQIEHGAGTKINFSASLIGHPDCNRYGLCLVVNGRLYDAFDRPDVIIPMQNATALLVFDRIRSGKTIRAFLGWLLRHPSYWEMAAGWLVGKVWRMKWDLLRDWGRVRTISFFIHNFMDSSQLVRDRIDACVFHVMTADGPVSMCLHNAKRDAFILKPIRLFRGAQANLWNPVTGTVSGEMVPLVTPDLSRRKLQKGRAKANAKLQRN